MNRDRLRLLCDELDAVMTAAGMTLPEVMEALTRSYNCNPAVIGRGLFRTNGPEAFSAYAERCRRKCHTYPAVAEALDVGGFPSRIGLRHNKSLISPDNADGEVFPLIWMARK